MGLPSLMALFSGGGGCTSGRWAPRVAAGGVVALLSWIQTHIALAHLQDQGTSRVLCGRIQLYFNSRKCSFSSVGAQEAPVPVGALPMASPFSQNLMLILHRG